MNDKYLIFGIIIAFLSVTIVYSLISLSEVSINPSINITKIRYDYTPSFSTFIQYHNETQCSDFPLNTSCKTVNYENQTVQYVSKWNPVQIDDNGKRI